MSNNYAKRTTISDEIFFLNGENLSRVPARDMREGFLGKTLEDALQTFLEKYPEIIPGSQIDFSGDEPPRFALLRREMPVAGWSLDHLYVDQFGILTLVETKLLQNPESRRNVIGQIIEYAANAQDTWGAGLARQFAAEFWIKKGKALEEVLQERFPDLAQEDLWRNIENNLRQGRIRLLIAADIIHPEVRRMIEYLNNEMQNVEVLGLELRMYGEKENQLIFVPRIIGQTQAIIDRKSSSSNSVMWSPELLREKYENLPDKQKESLTRILNWAIENNRFIESQAKNPVFGVLEKGGNRILSFYVHKEIYLWLEEKRYKGGKEMMNNLLDELKLLGLFDPNLSPSTVTSGRHADKNIWELS